MSRKQATTPVKKTDEPKVKMMGFSFEMPQDVYDQLEDLSRVSQQSMAHWGREAFIEFLSTEEILKFIEVRLAREKRLSNFRKKVARPE